MKGKAVQGIILFVMIVCMLAVYPGKIVKRDITMRSGDLYYELTPELQPGMSSDQYFVAKQSYVKDIDFAVDTQNAKVKEGTLRFELFDAEENLLYNEEVPYSDVINRTYYSINVEMKLKRNQIYHYRITNIDVTENIPSVVYSTEESMYSEPNCGLYYEGVQQAGEALTRYVWRGALKWNHLLGIWGFIAAVGFFLCEIVASRKMKEEK